METQLSFTRRTVLLGSFGPEASVPDLLPFENLQNKTEYELDETDEIYEGYGKRKTVYPYRQRDVYTHEVRESEVACALLENQFLRAEFLPEYGGRLWRLYDKLAKRELLYTNDVLRASNLAVRNAWFSGGVEWNVGVIGHTPLTTEPLFCAHLTAPGGEPVLRMYEYERIRGVVYQMDFWLSEETPALYCAMRIANPAADVIPMYWWSNIAVPEYENGRILVPAYEAYTSTPTRVTKVDVPEVNGVDISHYKNIPGQVDYFFNIPKQLPKFIANVDEAGYGLLHASTSRLQSRKLFSWGNNEGSARWQEFLTQNAGRYLEIQGGLGKTQYGCIPMAPHTAWDWVEMYSPLQLSQAEHEAPFLRASASLAARIARHQSVLSQALKYARSFAKTPAEVWQQGSGYAALENTVRATQGLQPIAPHLDFASQDARQREWHILLETGVLPEPQDAPGDYMQGSFWLKQLQHAVQKQPESWYAWYQLGLIYWEKEQFVLAKDALLRADEISGNAFTQHALAVLALREGYPQLAASYILAGVRQRLEDESYVKEALRVLQNASAWREICELVQEELPSEISGSARIQLYLAQALHQTGQHEPAAALIAANGGLEVPDLREGEISIGKLWREVHTALRDCEDEPVPYRFQFDAMEQAGNRL